MIYIAPMQRFGRTSPARSRPRSLRELLAALADVAPFAILIAARSGESMPLVTTTRRHDRGSLAIISARSRRPDAASSDRAMHNTIKFSEYSLHHLTAYVFSYAISFAGIGEKVSVHRRPPFEQAEFFLALFVLYSILAV